MVSPTNDDLDGITKVEKYRDDTLVRVFVLRTTRDAYPSELAYRLHYGATQPNPPETLDDETIRRYDNSHEDTKGHELHVAPDPEPRRSSSQGWSNSGSGSGRKSRKRSSMSIEATTTTGDTND